MPLVVHPIMRLQEAMQMRTPGGPLEAAGRLRRRLPPRDDRGGLLMLGEKKELAYEKNDSSIIQGDGDVVATMLIQGVIHRCVYRHQAAPPAAPTPPRRVSSRCIDHRTTAGGSAAAGRWLPARAARARRTR